jgi:hypothetical protein
VTQRPARVGLARAGRFGEFNRFWKVLRLSSARASFAKSSACDAMRDRIPAICARLSRDARCPACASPLPGPSCASFY